MEPLGRRFEVAATPRRPRGCGDKRRLAMLEHLPIDLLLADCVVCGQPIEDEQEAVSTYCGSLHSDCYDAHIQNCMVCDEDGAYHGDD
jgi:hypothetical protein